MSPSTTSRTASALALSLLSLVLVGAGTLPSGVREPVALAPTSAAGSVFAACANGTLVRLDGRTIAGEWQVASALSDLLALDGGRSLIALDPDAHEILLLSGDEARVVDRRSMAQPSKAIQAGESLVVGSTWGRKLTRLAMIPPTRGQAGWSFADAPTKSLELTFEPREMAWSSEGLLFVADAFGGRLALVDVESWQIVGGVDLPAHNIRAMHVTDDGRLLIAHQILDPLARTSLDDLQWGNLVRNVVREMKVVDLQNGCGPLVPQSQMTHLGEFGKGAADPSSLLLVDGRGTLITLAGANELLLVDPITQEQRRWAVGRRPVAALSLDHGRTCVVANSLDGSISFVDLDGEDVVSVSLGGELVDDPVARGRRLFFDASLSHDAWMSCHSCHTDGHTAGGLADTLGDDSYGTPKRVLSLLGLAGTAPYSWNGSQSRLEQQVEKSLRSTMHASALDDDVVSDLSAFLRTLSPPPALEVMHPEAVASGAELFRTAGCTECHVPPMFTSAESYSVSLSDEVGARVFNPPSLRGVGRRPRLFHDGRYRQLEQLLVRAGHPGTDFFNQQQIENVAAYLRSL